MAVGENPPVPDPTVLTTEQLLREVERVKELMHSEVDGMERECVEKFRAIEQQFKLVESQRVEQKKDTKDAVDAAFSAAKEAVREQTTASDRAIAKSETSMLEQLKQLGSSFDSTFEGVRRDLDGLKERISGSEQQKLGVNEARAATGTVVGYAIGAAGVLIALLAAVAAILTNG